MVSLKLSRKLILITVLVIACLLLIFKIHGYSMNAWQGFYGPNFDTGYQLGTSQNIRSDDWGVTLPYNASQIFSKTPYSQINPNIFNGHRMDFLPGTSLPTKSWIMAFRPQSWGYFLSLDYGLAWQWMFLTLFLWLVLFLIFENYFQLDLKVSLLLASAFVLSPHFALWSYCSSLSVSFSVFCFYCTSKALHASQLLDKLKWIFLGTWLAICFAVTLYPPFLVIAFIAIVLWFLTFEFNKEQLTRTNIALLLGFTFFSVGIFGFYIYENLDLVTIASNTVYPGKRFSTGGGGYPWWQTFLSSFVSLESITDFTEFQGNICEASGYLNLIPFFLFFFWFNLKKFDRKTIFQFSILLGACLFIYIWQIIGLPEWLSKAFLLSRSTPNRAVLYIGLFQVIMVPLFITTLPKLKKPNIKWPFMAWTTFALFVFIFFLVNKYINAGKSFGSYFLTALTILMVFTLLKNKIKWFAFLFLIHSLFQSFWFNPIVLLSNFENFLINDDNLKAIRTVDAEMTASGKTLILIANSNPLLCNLPRMIGVKAFCGNMPVPQESFWQMLDPEHQFIQAWNRYAEINFIVNEQVPDYFIHSPQNDVVNVHFNPNSSVLDKLGINGLIIEAPLLAKFPNFKVAAQLYGGNYLLMIKNY